MNIFERNKSIIIFSLIRLAIIISGIIISVVFYLLAITYIEICIIHDIPIFIFALTVLSDGFFVMLKKDKYFVGEQRERLSYKFAKIYIVFTIFVGCICIIAGIIFLIKDLISMV